MIIAFMFCFVVLLLLQFEKKNTERLKKIQKIIFFFENLLTIVLRFLIPDNKYKTTNNCYFKIKMEICFCG